MALSLLSLLFFRLECLAECAKFTSGIMRKIFGKYIEYPNTDRVRTALGNEKEKNGLTFTKSFSFFFCAKFTTPIMERNYYFHKEDFYYVKIDRNLCFNNNGL